MLLWCKGKVALELTTFALLKSSKSLVSHCWRDKQTQIIMRAIERVPDVVYLLFLALAKKPVFFLTFLNLF
jgi:hypothetical protein